MVGYPSMNFCGSVDHHAFGARQLKTRLWVTQPAATISNTKGVSELNL